MASQVFSNKPVEQYYWIFKIVFLFDSLTLAFECMNGRTNFVLVSLSVTVITGHAVHSGGREGRHMRVGVTKPSAMLSAFSQSCMKFKPVYILKWH